MIRHFLLRLGIWLLLTANFTPVNIIIGISLALLLPQSSTRPERLRDLLRSLARVVIAIPQAYWEAVEMMLR
ncbi:MAG: cation:proton antiporter, partial [Cyanobacteria bacterium]|nr:cation:proton antiporter [Cyanobacteriota bacterium]MDW8200621.1 cation:proton antiporter [Cyanobacteriota bacterium SKYGB_h_bin112]